MAREPIIAKSSIRSLTEIALYELDKTWKHFPGEPEYAVDGSQLPEYQKAVDAMNNYRDALLDEIDIQHRDVRGNVRAVLELGFGVEDKNKRLKHYMTPKEIARHLTLNGFTESAISRVLENNPDLFRRSYFETKDGKPLYTLRSVPVKGKERLIQFLDNIAAFGSA